MNGWIASAAGALFAIALMFWVGFNVQPWAPWWLQGGSGQSLTVPIDTGPVDGLPPASDLPPIDGNPPAAPVTSGAVSDVQRFQLCLSVGLDPQTCIVMTAISIAEDGSGNPSIVSPPNFNGTVDIGIWQINSSHIGSCGIQSQQWLYDPSNNARAMLCVLGASRNYCAWSTFDASCGVGHTGAYRAFIAGATQLAQGIAWQHP